MLAQECDSESGFNKCSHDISKAVAPTVLKFRWNCPVRLPGSTLGGSFINSKGIYRGFCTEFGMGGLRIFTTSPVQWIGPVEDPGEMNPDR